jgi:predicted phosphoadenosine phosphosulfate sulfurtransferase
MDVDVYVAAKDRIKHVIDIFDSIVVCFSGGKDSLATLHLVKEVYDELGIKTPINVVFRDEELIPDDVIEFVQSYAKLPWINMLYFACQLESNKYILGKTYEYIQWDKRRKWMRPKPENAILLNEDRIYDQYTMDNEIANRFAGKVALVNGIRAQESMVRFRSCVNKKNENYINESSSGKAMMVKPIYDWKEDDIFRYFWEKNITYCKIYDIQMLNGEALRVATPLHAESAKRFDKIKTRYPVFYQQLVDLFPEMLLQERYYEDLDQYALMRQYPETIQGIEAYIMEQITDSSQRSLALKRLNKVRNWIGKTDGYTVKGVFKQFITGAYKRTLLPTVSTKK